MSPRVGYYCSRCSRYNEYPLPAGEGAGTCERCGNREPPDPSPAVTAGGPIDRCPHCDNLHFYTRKDFPQQLGCFAVAATILLSSLAYAAWDFPAALVVLVAASAADIILYQFLGEVTVCYRCHTELRGFQENPEHEAFDMHRAEEYEQGR
ncbi:MAG TPA: hypothetical protein VEK15_19665 [Vicinamibacteria bacterium]|nr:hypothetical protein [Vicinamibacteria bacterium]